MLKTDEWVEPTPAQAEAGNYKKPRVNWRGLEIAIENPAGSVRKGKGWETHMRYDYGYVCRSGGVDGDEVDVYLGPSLEFAPTVYVVHQRKYGDWEKYDEDKCMIGFLSEEQARAAYLAHYDDKRFLGPITAMPVEKFIEKVKATWEKPAMIKAVVLFLKSKVRSHIRAGRSVSEYDRGAGKKSGMLHRVPVRNSLFSWSGIEPRAVYADYARLSKKHSDQMHNAVSALHHVEWVMEHPHVFIPASDGRFVMFIRRGARDKCVVIDPNIRRGSRGYLVRSAYNLEKGQLRGYLAAVYKGMKGVVKMRKSLSAGTLSPGFLSSLSSQLPGVNPDNVAPVIKIRLPVPRDMVQLSKQNNTMQKNIMVVLLKAHAPDDSPSVGDRIEFTSDRHTDKGPSSGTVTDAKITVDGLYLKIKHSDEERLFSWDDIREGAEKKSDLWLIKSHVDGHQRRTASGKIVFVKPYTNKVMAHGDGDGQLDMFSDAPPAAPKPMQPVADPADQRKKFYVTMIRNPGPRQRVAYLAGPFDRHEDALAQVAPARKHAEEADPRSAFDAFGTAGVVADKHGPGVLNGKLGIGEAAPSDSYYTPEEIGGMSMSEREALWGKLVGRGPKVGDVVPFKGGEGTVRKVKTEKWVTNDVSGLYDSYEVEAHQSRYGVLPGTKAESQKPKILDLTITDMIRNGYKIKRLT